jgi:DNA-binding FadR family transcriptional regulator
VTWDTKASAVALELEKEILRQTFRAGMVLPPETELATRFKVSRHILREAISRLVAKGLITVRPAHGTRATDSRRGWTLDRLVELIRAFAGTDRCAGLFVEYLELRRFALGEAVAVACDRKSEAHVADIRFLIWDLEENVRRRNHRAQIACAEREVIVAIGSASGSTAIQMLLNSFARFDGFFPWFLARTAHCPIIPLATYWQLAGLIERGAAGAARQLVFEALGQVQPDLIREFRNGRSNDH